MKTPTRPLPLLSFWLPLLVLLAAAARAQPTATGTLEGRVSNPSTGENLELARITVEGTGLEAFTDADGQYRLAGVPAGAVRVRAFRTGVVAQTLAATVAAG
ncbi:MAG: carboxypeptidase regulatory-like domain-containing protein, partial [Opitutaceae bacterium]|nr:carboxypeptidase regulatory-like domain-containing protein [Opitutaceae bacterium]